MYKKNYLGEFEEFVLLALFKLGNNAYGITIRSLINNSTERNVSLGMVYTTLNRLEKKGLVSSYLGESTPARGGRAKNYFKITSSGIEALRKAENDRAKMRKGFEKIYIPGTLISDSSGPG